MGSVLQLYPMPQREVRLERLYLPSHAGSPGLSSAVVYTNFVASLDGRIAIEESTSGECGVPRSIANPRDWRLYQELAAGADVLLVSGRYLRQLAKGTAQDNLPLSADPTFLDLRAWRAHRGLVPQPALAIVTASLDLPLGLLSAGLQRQVYVASGHQAPRGAVREIEHSGGNMLYVGEGRVVDGRRLIAELAARGLRRVYSIAGPGVLETLLRARVLDRVYLTQVHRLIGGLPYNTLLEGALFQPPVDLKLGALFYDDGGGEACRQFFAMYETARH